MKREKKAAWHDNTKPFYFFIHLVLTEFWTHWIRCVVVVVVAAFFLSMKSLKLRNTNTRNKYDRHEKKKHPTTTNKRIRNVLWTHLVEQERQNVKGNWRKRQIRRAHHTMRQKCACISNSFAYLIWTKHTSNTGDLNGSGAKDEREKNNIERRFCRPLCMYYDIHEISFLRNHRMRSQRQQTKIEFQQKQKHIQTFRA